MVGYHPAIGQVNILLKLYRDHFIVRLDNNPCQPIPRPVAFVIFMIAVYFYTIANSIILALVRRGCKAQFCQSGLHFVNEALGFPSNENRFTLRFLTPFWRRSPPESDPAHQRKGSAALQVQKSPLQPDVGRPT